MSGEVDLKRLQLLAELDDEGRAALADDLEPMVLPRGTLVFEEGEQAEGVLFVVEGGLRLECRSSEVAVELGPGAAVGAFALVASGPREVRAETTSHTRLLVLRRSAFRRLQDSDPRAACRLLEAIVRDTAKLTRESLV